MNFTTLLNTAKKHHAIPVENISTDDSYYNYYRAKAVAGTISDAVRRQDTEDFHEVLKKDYHHVFVYGTLKRGNGNNQILTRDHYVSTPGRSMCVKHQSVYQGTSYTKSDKFMMFDFAGSYPMVFPTHVTIDGKTAKVCGELWKVPTPTLLSMDALEGHPNFYHRVKTTVKPNTGGEPVEAWMYVGNLQHYVVDNGKGGYKMPEYLELIRPRVHGVNHFEYLEWSA